MTATLMADGAASLLPRTFLRVFPDGVTPEAAASIDLPQLQSAALEVIGCSKEVVEEAKCVLRSSNSTNTDATFRGIVENVCHPQERRQGLGRKRARFSLKPVTSMESRNVHMELNTDHLADPEEYFSAIEKFEFADKELKKLKGHDPSDRLEQVAAVRKRRPGILGKRASYKPFQADFASLENHVPTPDDRWIVSSKQHGISVDPGSKASDNDNLHNASQETETTQNAFLCGTEVDGSIAPKENKVGDMLETLLSSFEILDDDGGAALLQEQLQLKNISVDKLRLPVTPDAVKGAINLKMKEWKKDKVHLPLKSTARNRSPLAPIFSLLRKQSSVDPLNDPYSPLSLAKDQCSGGSYSTDKVNDKKLKLSLSTQGGPISEVPSPRICSPIQSENLVKLFDEEVDSIKHSGNSSDRCSRLTTGSPRDKFESSITWQPVFGNEHLGSESLNRTGGEDVTDLSAPAPPGHVRACESRKENSEHELESEIEHREIETQRPEGLQEQPTSAIDATSAIGTPTPLNGDSGTLGANFVENDKVCCNNEFESSITWQPVFGNEHLGSESLNRTGGEDVTDLSARDIHCSAPPGHVRACESRKESSEHELESEIEHREIETQRPEGLKEQPTSAIDATSAIGTPTPLNGDSGTLGANLVENDKFESAIACQPEPEFGNEHPGSKILTKTGEDFTDFSACGIHYSAPPGDDRPCKSNKESLEHELECEMEHRETDTQSPEGLQEQPTSANDATSVISALMGVNGDAATLGVNLVENDKEVQHSSQVLHEGSSIAKKTVGRPKGRSFNARKSLADAGTKWESGLRRSTRNRIRPLEFWRGEKLLYGRIHESLATVIGIKYSSPGGGALKVKSYVSEEHADLLELVSLH